MEMLNHIFNGILLVSTIIGFGILIGVFWFYILNRHRGITIKIKDELIKFSILGILLIILPIILSL